MNGESISEDERVVIVAFQVFDIALYFSLLFFAIYMTVAYVIMDNKHTLDYIKAFYTLSVLLAVSKIAMLVVQVGWTGELYQWYIYEISNQSGFYSWLFIGLMQIALMAELAIQVKMSAHKIAPQEGIRRIKNNTYVLYGATFLLLGFCVVDAINLSYLFGEWPNYTSWRLDFYTTTYPRKLVAIAIGVSIAYFNLSFKLDKYFDIQL